MRKFVFTNTVSKLKAMKFLIPLLTVIISLKSCTFDQSQINAKATFVNFNDYPTWTIESNNPSIIENGFTFRNMPKADTTLQINNYIRSIFQDKAGNLWFGTHGRGISRYNGKILKFFSGDDNFNSIVIRDIKQDNKGWMWIATNKGVYSFDGKTFTTHDIASGIDDNEVWAVLVDQTVDPDKTGIWFGTEAGAYFYDGKSFSKFDLPHTDLSRFPSAYKAPALINNMLQDKSGRIWFATNGNGVFCYDKKISGDVSKQLKQYSQKNGLCNDVVQGIYLDKKGNLWFATRFGGASKFDGNKFTTFNDKNGLKNNFVWTVYEDRFGTIWFATAGGGTTRFNGRDFETFTTKEGLPDNYVQTILDDRDGNMWFGTGSGLARFDGARFIKYQGNFDGC